MDSYHKFIDPNKSPVDAGAKEPEDLGSVRLRLGGFPVRRSENPSNAALHVHASRHFRVCELRERAQNRKQLHCSRKSQAFTENERSVCYIVDCIRGKCTVLFAHCVGCMAGQGECCLHIASVLFYIEAWNRVNEKLSCTQVKCSCLMPTAVREVPYAQANKTTSEGIAKSGEAAKVLIPVPDETDLSNFYTELNSCKTKPVSISHALLACSASVAPPFSRFPPSTGSSEKKVFLQLPPPGRQFLAFSLLSLFQATSRPNFSCLGVFQLLFRMPKTQRREPIYIKTIPVVSRFS